MNLATWLDAGPKGSPALAVPLPLELEEDGRSRNARALLRICGLAVVGLMGWSTITPIRELASAPGQLLPEGEVRAIQHLEGGIVSTILVRAGASVRAGDALIALQPVTMGSELSQLEIKAKNLQLQRQQIEALLSAKSLVLDDVGNLNPDLAAGQQGVYDARLARRASEQRLLQARLEQRKKEIGGLEAELAVLGRIVSIQTEQFQMRKKLLGQGFTSRRAYLDAAGSLQQAISQKNAAETRLASARDAVTEAENQLSTASDEARRLWSEELASTITELEETGKAIDKARDRLDRLTVRAPVAGIVQMIAPKSSGEVIKPGDVVAKVVPVGGKLVAEVQVKPDDVGHVRVGDHTDIKVSTFDPGVYGKLSGKVLSVSPSTFQRENGELYFRATVSVDQSELGDATHHAKLTPGMVVTADIVTGSKSLAQYLLKPVFKTVGMAFSER